MAWLLPKVTQADITVWASPVYCDGITGTMKILMERLLPKALPFFEIRDGHIRHPRREGVKQGKMVLVSNCGFWEMDNFDPLLAHFDAYCRNVGAQFVGALLRPHGPALGQMIEMGAPVRDVLDAARDAGSQLVRDGKIFPETLDTISRDLLPRETYMQLANRYFREELEKLGR
jgi:multimeric flavodoxin WrbA